MGVVTYVTLYNRIFAVTHLKSHDKWMYGRRILTNKAEEELPVYEVCESRSLGQRHLSASLASHNRLHISTSLITMGRGW